jgi:hypothetical protein
MILHSIKRFFCANEASLLKNKLFKINGLNNPGLEIEIV